MQVGTSNVYNYTPNALAPLVAIDGGEALTINGKSYTKNDNTTDVIQATITGATDNTYLSGTTMSYTMANATDPVEIYYMPVVTLIGDTDNYHQFDNVQTNIVLGSNPIDRIEVRRDGEDLRTFNDYTSDIIIWSNGDYEFKVIDSDGKYVTKTIKYSKIESEVPTIEVNTNGYESGTITKNSVTILLSTTTCGASGVIKFQSSIDNGINWIDIPSVVSAGTSTSSVTKTIDTDTDKSYIFRGLSGAGVNSIATSPVHVIVDKTAPVINEVTGNPTTWTKEDVTITVDATDAKSGIAEYSFDGGTTWQTENSKTFSQNGAVNVKVKDNMGNMSSYTTFNIDKIDKAVPEMMVITNGYQIGSVVSNDIKFTIKQSSNVNSGITKYQYSIGSLGNWIDIPEKTIEGTTEKCAELIVNTDTNANYRFRIISGSGVNCAPHEVTGIKVDKAVPTITEITGNPTSWTYNDVTLTVNANDTVSGIDTYSFDNGDTWQSGNTKTFAQNGTVNIKVKDKVGRISNVSTVAITKIDKTAPTITEVIGNPTSWTKNDVMITVTTNDAQSGIASYSFDNGETWQVENTKTFSQNGTVNVKVKDNVGLISDVSTVVIDKIDKTEPVITGIEDSKTYYGDKQVTITDINIKTIKLNGVEITSPFTITAKDGNQTIEVTDMAGNVKTYTVVVKPFVPKIIEGMDNKCKAGEKKDMRFRSDAKFADFLNVTVDGVVIAPSNYIAEEGSIIVTLKADYVATLSAGTHVISINARTGSASADFDIESAPVSADDTNKITTDKTDSGKSEEDKTTAPKTADNNDIFLWIALMFISGGAVASVSVLRKRNSRIQRS